MFHFDTLLFALSMMLTVKGILVMFIGTIIGLIFGAIPGLSGVTALIVLIPMTYGMDPVIAMLLLGSAYGAATYGGAVPAILINTPGEAPNAATVLDGFPLSQKGKSGMALGAAATASTMGGLFGLLVAFFFIPVLSGVVLAFSYAEFLMITIFGLSMIAVLTQGTLLKGLIAGGLGIMFSCVGYDPMTTELRYTFGLEFLWDGIQVVPALFGLLALGEIMDLLIKTLPIAGTTGKRAPGSGVWDGVMETLKRSFLTLRCSSIGFFIGVIPGLGGTVAGFFSYVHAKQTCRNSEGFGQGDVRGVIASEAANDAKEGGALLPTLGFGIPGSAAMAVLLGALTLHGVEIGQSIFIKHLDIVYMLLLSILGAHIFAAGIGLALAEKMALVTRIRPAIFTPILLMICLLGSFTLRNSMGDVVITIIFGLLGYEMRKFGFSRIALLLGLLLGHTAEVSFRQTLMTREGAMSFFSRPISLTILIFTLVSLSYPYISAYIRRRRKVHHEK
ncbi:MAG: tripartite tricarboxylate transporter permease [Desulfobacteraceae bacterium]|nr:tripartite tricarboxylate transporter permease [Desulfobacteraceae bacterium]